MSEEVHKKKTLVIITLTVWLNLATQWLFITFQMKYPIISLLIKIYQAFFIKKWNNSQKSRQENIK